TSSSRPVVASLPLTTPTRLPERSVTLPNLLSLLSLSSLASPLADFVPLPPFAFLPPAFALLLSPPLLSPPLVLVFFAGLVAALSSTFVAPAAGTISPITFGPRIARTGQARALSGWLGRAARSASPLLIASAVACGLVVGRICQCKLRGSVGGGLGRGG